MGLFGGDSESSSSQETTVTSANQQGNAGAALNKSQQYNNTGAAVGYRGNLAESGGVALNLDDGASARVYNANSTELAQIAAEISLGALDYYDQQNKRSLELAEKVAQATTSSNKDIINELAAITEKQSQSEALTLNEQLLKYGVVALIGYFVFEGARRA